MPDAALSCDICSGGGETDLGRCLGRADGAGTDKIGRVKSGSGLADSAASSIARASSAMKGGNDRTQLH